MPKLTAKQECFARELSGNISQSEAYRRAYQAGNMSAESIAVKACALAKQDKIRIRVEEYRAALADKALWTREAALSMLVEIATTAKEHACDGDMRYNAPAQTVAIRAIEQANKMCGYHEPVKLEHSGALHIALSEELEQWAR